MAGLNNWYDVPLVYFGLKNKSDAKLRNSDIVVPLHNNSEYWWKVIGLCSLRRLADLIEDGFSYRVFVKELRTLSPQLSLDELPFKYFSLFRLLKLLGKGASYSDGILKLNFFPKKPSFEIDMWSAMPVVLYDVYYERFLDKLLPEGVGGKMVVDIGAYIGDTATYFALSGAKQVIAFEPHPLLYKKLLRNIELNGLSMKVKAINVAVGGDLGEVELKSPSDEYKACGEAAFSTFAKGETVAKVPIVPLEYALADVDDVDVAKINCEGCEFPIILGADTWVLRKIETYIVQIHQYANPAPVISKFKKARFRVFHMVGEFYKACRCS